MRKIAVFTGTRADYGIMKNLIRLIDESEETILQLIVSGSHLSNNFGYTSDEISNDGFTASKKIVLPLDDDSSVGVCQSMSTAVLEYSKAIDELRPDIIVILGDRYEALCMAQVALMMHVPVAHIHGGEVTEGALDEKIRHAITKLSSIHFTSHEEYSKRVIQLGENPECVFTVGSLGVERLLNTELFSREELEKEHGIVNFKKIVILTYHPETNNNNSINDIDIILSALSKINNTFFVISYPNADEGNKYISNKIEQFVYKNRNKCAVSKNFGYKMFGSLMSIASLIIGNSSSGIIEAPSFGVPTINVGDRQLGRIKAKSVIDCEVNEKIILDTIDQVLTNDFKITCCRKENPYYKENTSLRVMSILKSIDLNSILKKPFYDLNVHSMEIS